MEKVRNQISEDNIIRSNEIILNYFFTRIHTPVFSFSFEGESGCLVLTNIRLLFYETKGIIHTSYKFKWDRLLREIRDVSTGGSWNKYLTIDGTKYFLENADTNAVRMTFMKAIQRAGEEQLAFPSSTQQVQQMVNVNINSPSASPDTIYCTHCGFKNDSDANYCKKCGTKIV
ncbi:MAG TPA: zinc-ribbon domain-containing protein [Candidatus Deferrimicrobium sp.]|nr:zinc-ribbon domain-containing protein [Candidatus Deferrimicrobium sp.]